MAIDLRKGVGIDLKKTSDEAGAGALNKLRVELSWDKRVTSGAAFDADASCFMLDANGKCVKASNFVFYNNTISEDGSVVHSGDNRTGEGEGADEIIRVELAKVSADVQKLLFVVSIHEWQERKQNFGMISNAMIRFFNDENNIELAKADLSEDMSAQTALIFAELYRHNGEWKVKASGQGFDGGLDELVKNYYTGG